MGKSCSHLLIQGENPYIYSWKVESDVKEQQFQQQLIQASHKEWEEFQRLTMQEFALMRSAAQGGNKEQARAQADSLQQLTEKLSDQIAQHNIAIMKQSPINAAWMGELHRMGMSVKFRKDYPYKKEVQQLYNLLDDAQKETSIGRVCIWLESATVVKVGEEAAMRICTTWKERFTAWLSFAENTSCWTSGVGDAVLASCRNRN